jgi:fructokinase
MISSASQLQSASSMNPTLAYGVDLGGTKLEAIAFQTADPLNPIARLRTATEASRGYEAIIENVNSLVEQLIKQTGVRPRAVGIGHPGSQDEHGLIKNSNTVSLNGRPLACDLGAIFRMEVQLENDAHCFALAEAKLGAARGHNSVFGVILGTGVGGGIVINGQIVRGKHHAGGEWGHNVLAPLAAGDVAANCYCGRKGCIETWISGPALERYYSELLGEAQTSGRFTLLEQIARSKTEEQSKRVIDRLIDYFGAGLAQVINILDPECVVLGGGVSNLEVLYERAAGAVSKNVFNPQFNTPIVKNQLGDSAGVFGAALLTMPAQSLS